MIDTHLTEGERAHAASILEPATLRPVPSQRVTKILVASPVRKPPAVVAQFLRTLAWQRTHGRVSISYLFAPNFGPTDAGAEDSLKLLRAFEPGSTVVLPNFGEADGYGEGTETRQWSTPAFNRLALLKNHLLQHAINATADFVWLVDADVMTDPGTLQSLIDAADHEVWLQNESTPLPIVAGVYWTRWQRPQADSRQQVHAGPQVWLTHPYGLSGRGWTEQDFRMALIERRRLQVWGLGACTLIPVHALQKGVSFARFDGLPPGPMSDGEDRHFCAWATSKHVKLFADAWPDIYHAYHPADYAQLVAVVDTLDYPAAATPVLGSLVSAKLELLEPVRDDFNRWFRPPARWLRGRLGALPTLPQVEETLATLVPGQSSLIKLHFPVTWPNAHLRMQSRIARLTLLDCKPFRAPPVVDEELFVGGATGRSIDTVAHTLAQLEDLHAHAHQYR